MNCSHCHIREAREGRKQCQKCQDQTIKWKKEHPKRTKELNMKSLDKNRIKWRLAGQKHFLKMKLLVVDYYSGGKNKCECCGENNIEFLNVNHINGGGLKHRKEIKTSGGGMFYRWLIQNDFPEGFNILCWNCNWASWRYKICPHKK